MKKILLPVLALLITVPVFGAEDSYNDNSTVVRAVQQELNDLGYNCGAIDGEFGSMTGQAIAEFQSAHSIQRDGMITRDLLAELWMAEHAGEASVQTRQTDFLTYYNERFGYAISYPSWFVQDRPLPANGDGIWMSGNGASLTMSGSFNVMDDTPESYSRYSSDESGITESHTGEDYYEYYRVDGNTEHYQYTKIDDLCVSFYLEYPLTEHAQYSSIIEEMKKNVVTHAAGPVG